MNFVIPSLTRTADFRLFTNITVLSANLTNRSPRLSSSLSSLSNITFDNSGLIFPPWQNPSSVASSHLHSLHQRLNTCVSVLSLFHLLWFQIVFVLVCYDLPYQNIFLGLLFRTTFCCTDSSLLFSVLYFIISNLHFLFASFDFHPLLLRLTYSPISSILRPLLTSCDESFSTISYLLFFSAWYVHKTSRGKVI